VLDGSPDEFSTPLERNFVDATANMQYMPGARPEYHVWGGGLEPRAWRAWHGGYGMAEPPAGSRGRAPGRGSGGEAPLKLKTFYLLDAQRKQQICLILSEL